MKYKCSAFNYITKTDKGNLIYNTLYNTLVRLSDTELACYYGDNKCNEDLEKQFIENGLWVDDNLDELNNLLRYCYYLTKYQSSDPQITITTTTKCNARCFYCYEKGLCQKDIKPQVTEDIIRFVKTLDTSKGVRINWFGGEPLMNTDCIDKISNELKESGIDYMSFIITNGSLINDDIIEKMLGLWNTKQVQITIDGTEEEYSRRKNYSDNNGEYLDLLWKISKAADKGISVQIRINIDRENAEESCILVEELEDFFGRSNNISYYPAFLDGVDKRLDDDERIRILKNIFDSVKDKSKLTINDKLYATPKISPCMMYDKYSFTIDVDGNVFRCEHQVGKAEKSIGKINNLTVDNAAVNIQELRDICRKCVFLPKCMGGCTSNYENGDDPCMIIRYMIQAYMNFL